MVIADVVGFVLFVSVSVLFWPPSELRQGVAVQRWVLDLVVFHHPKLEIRCLE